MEGRLVFAHGSMGRNRHGEETHSQSMYELDAYIGTMDQDIPD